MVLLRSLFEHAMETLSHTIEQTQDLSLMADGECRYGNVLFALEDVVRTGRPGRPRNTLKEGGKLRNINKGQQAHKQGPKRIKELRITNILIPNRILIMKIFMPKSLRL